jgi:hypothetical protein
MSTIRNEVRELINVNDRIQSAVVQGGKLTNDEKALIAMCARELTASASESKAFFSEKIV